MSNPIIRVSGLEKKYYGKNRMSQVQALRQINLTVQEGEFVVLHGSSGCGKSTLLFSVGALLHPDSGEVVIHGQDPYRLASSDRAVFRAKNLGFMFQSFYLVPYLDVLQNVVVTEMAVGRSCGARAIELLENFGLSHRLHHYPSELSVGEQQRVALARALCGGASILLADEPTGNLDAGNSRAALALIAAFSKQGGTVLMVTHDPIAMEYASRKIQMKDGALV